MNIVIRNFVTFFSIKRIYHIYSDFENINRNNLLAFNEKLKNKKIILSNNEIKVFK